MALAAGAAALGCGEEAPEAAFAAEASRVQVQLRGVAFQRFVGEQLEFEVRAASGLFEPGRRVAELHQVETRFRSEERGQVELKAQNGDFDLEKRNFVMNGDVEGTTASGEHFETSEARYDRTAARIVVEKPVTLRSGRVSSRGSGLVLDLTSREFTLFDIEGRREVAP